jgi:carbon storage regulator
MVGNDIEIVVVRIDANTVKIGVQAPPHVAINRREIYDSMKAAGEVLSLAKAKGAA